MIFILDRMKWGLYALLLSCVSVSSAFAVNIERGRELFELHCSQCHMPGNDLLQGIPEFSIRDSLLRPDGMLVEVIRNGTNTMPGYYGILKDKEIVDVIQYMRMIW